MVACVALAFFEVSTMQLTPHGFVPSVAPVSLHSLLYCGEGHPGSVWFFASVHTLESTQIVALSPGRFTLLGASVSSHVLSTLNVVVSGVCVFVTWKSQDFTEADTAHFVDEPPATVTSLDVYPSTDSSVTVYVYGLLYRFCLGRPSNVHDCVLLPLVRTVCTTNCSVTSSVLSMLPLFGCLLVPQIWKVSVFGRLPSLSS